MSSEQVASAHLRGAVRVVVDDVARNAAAVVVVGRRADVAGAAARRTQHHLAPLSEQLAERCSAQGEQKA